MFYTNGCPPFVPASTMLEHALSFIRLIPTVPEDKFVYLVYQKAGTAKFGCRGIVADSERGREYLGRLRRHYPGFTDIQQRQAMAFMYLIRCLVGTAKLWLDNPELYNDVDPVSGELLLAENREVLDPAILLSLYEPDLETLSSLENMESFLREVSFVKLKPRECIWVLDDRVEKCAEVQRHWYESTAFLEATLELFE